MDAAGSCLGVAPQSALLLSRSFADAAAVARALSYSLSDSDAAPEHPTTADLGAAATTPAFTHGAAGARHPPTGSLPSSSSYARSRLAPAAGRRAGKRRPRPSKRAPTTYISTDAATFRLMVQRVTGADDDEAGQWQDAGGHHLSLGLLLPQLGVVGPLLPPDPAAAHDAAYAYASLPPAAPAATEQPLFPTLDSWNVMYGKNEVA